MRDFDIHEDHHEHHHRQGWGDHWLTRPLLLGSILLALLGMVVMTLWNALLPDLFGISSIGFWQAVGLLALCRVLFGGLGLRPGMFGLRRRMQDSWMQMTPEQREMFAHHRREGFGRRGYRSGRCGWREAREAREEGAQSWEERSATKRDAE